jgi:hypothetical protein
MQPTTASYFAVPTEAAHGFFASEIAGDLTRGALPPSLASARLNATFLDDEDVTDVCGHPASRAALLEEIDALVHCYGEDCPVSEIVRDTLPYALAARVLPSGYRRAAFDVALQDVLDADPRALAEWLEARCDGAGELSDVRIRLLGSAGDRLRLEITGELVSTAPEGDVENPLVPSDEVPLNAGCEPADQPRYCGYTTGGWTRLCPRCMAVHEAQRELLSTY